MEKVDLLKYEHELYEQGYNLIAGCDEAGRGPLCGPVVAAAVILPKDYKLEGLNDSKQLSEKKRDKFFEIIKIMLDFKDCYTDKLLFCVVNRYDPF